MAHPIVRTGLSLLVPSALALVCDAARADEPEQVEDAEGEVEADFDEPPPAGSVPAPVDTSGRDLEQEAQAMELAGFRAQPVVVITSDPPGATVSVGPDTSCVTPCRLSLPPGRYRFAFEHGESEPIEALAEVSTREQLRVHGRLGEETPWGFILPTYLVGGIFTAGGISALLLYGGEAGPVDAGQSEVPADERRFHRNLGIVSLSVGVPLLGLATYLVISGGRSGEVRTSVAPRSPGLSLGPALDSEGRLAGLGVVATF
jgi:hypothetical protein